MLKENINILKTDLELKLDDLKNIKYSFERYKMYVEFDTIYIDNFDFLFKINMIVMEGLYKPRLNGFYENYKDVYKLHKITISEELTNYLTEKLKEHFEKKDVLC
jgi:hypothetical protein